MLYLLNMLVEQLAVVADSGMNIALPVCFIPLPLLMGPYL